MTPNVQMTSVCVDAGSWKSASKWRITISTERGSYAFEYTQGSAYRVYTTGKNRGQRMTIPVGTLTVYEQERLTNTMPQEPSYDDVMSSLTLDASSVDQSFDSWCDEFGYDTDSRKAFANYEQCRDTMFALRRLGISLTELLEEYKDY